jgi:molybdate transport system substrate-binding protein
MMSRLRQRRVRTRWLGRMATVLLVVTVTLLLGVPSALAQGRDVLVFAAASLKNALDEITAQYQRETGKRAVISYGASSALARQIEAAAPADLFISADLDWMDYLAKRNLIKAETRANLLGNRLVLIAPKASQARPAASIGPDFPLAEQLGSGRLAMADTKAVPAGKYGRAALELLGIWASVEGRLAQTENVRAALTLVSRGEAPLGIVYQTDAAADQNVKIVGMFPENTHPPIVYPAALVASSSHPDAAGYVAYLRSAAARPLFEKQGFTILPK